MALGSRNSTLTGSLKNRVNVSSCTEISKYSNTGGCSSMIKSIEYSAFEMGMGTTGLPAVSETVAEVRESQQLLRRKQSVGCVLMVSTSGVRSWSVMMWALIF